MTRGSIHVTSNMKRSLFIDSLAWIELQALDLIYLTIMGKYRKTRSHSRDYHTITGKAKVEEPH